MAPAAGPWRRRRRPRLPPAGGRISRLLPCNGFLSFAASLQLLVVLLLFLINAGPALGVRLNQRQPASSSPLWRFTSGLNRVAMVDLRNSVLQPLPQQQQQPSLLEAHQQQQQQQQPQQYPQQFQPVQAPPSRPPGGTLSLFQTLNEVASAQRQSPGPQEATPAPAAGAAQDNTVTAAPNSPPPTNPQSAAQQDSSTDPGAVASGWEQQPATGGGGSSSAGLPVRTDIPAPDAHHRHVLTSDGEVVPGFQEQPGRRPEGAPPFPPRPATKWDFDSPTQEGWSPYGSVSLFEGVPPHSSLAVLDGRSGFISLQPFQLAAPFTLVLVLNPLDIDRSWTVLELAGDAAASSADRVVLGNDRGSLVFEAGGTRLVVPGFWELDMWEHVSLVVEADGTMLVYKDAVVAGRDRTRAIPADIPRPRSFLGRGVDWSAGLFAGELDVLHHYPRALAPEEIKSHFEYWKSVDCVAAEWQPWGPCSRSCGGGIRYRQRSILVPPARWGLLCPPLSERETCNEQLCRQDCLLSDWSAWSECSTPCGGGSRGRTRTVLAEPQQGGTPCGELQQSEPCNPQPCPVDCVAGDWAPWGPCSERCGGGIRERIRPILVPQQHGGAACPSPLQETQPCNPSPCPVDCELGGWGEWSACSAECGGGESSRARPILVPAQYSGQPCDPVEETRACNEQECDIDCQMSDWSEWSPCSQPCGAGVRSRTRSVHVPASGKGLPCGSDIEYGPCNTEPCAPPPTPSPTPAPTSEPEVAPRVVIVPVKPPTTPAPTPAQPKRPKLIAEIVDNLSDIGAPYEYRGPVAQPPPRGFVAPVMRP